MSDWKNVQYKDGKMRTSEGGGGGGSSTFAGLDDVSFNNLQNGQVPKYNSTTHKWENANESGSGTVTDVQVDGTSVVNPQGVAEIETPNADAIEYDNQQSGLQATNMQDAIDELAQGSGGGGVEDVEVNGTSVVNAQKVAKITSYKEVTLAEYQALPSSKTSDGVMYCIKDIGGANQFPPLIYSDEEREVGVWRDGKPLYQKTMYLECPRTSDWTLVDDSVSYEMLLSASGYIDASTETHPMYNTLSYAEYPRFTVNKNTHKLYYYTSTQRNVWITFVYTKTTDTPGSGTWITQGGYAHHYSTTEQVIGTWIDGKPIYEKTIDCGIISRDKSWHTVAHNISNLEHVVEMQGIVFSTDGTEEFGAPNYRPTTDNGIVIGRSGANIQYINNWLDANANRLYVTIQYTKTTD